MSQSGAERGEKVAARFPSLLPPSQNPDPGLLDPVAREATG